jgi:hypothetical protein
VLTTKAARPVYKGSICPSGLATLHPAAETLVGYATKGCPSRMRRPWTLKETEAAITRPPPISVLEPEAMTQLQMEVIE